mmetsp:Transcript_44630/g.89528  ORF Transcript_44630/g.89528 Transcript_44630/m.89528 type:complete len:218 (-) Transcript_44630:58-711(-)
MCVWRLLYSKGRRVWTSRRKGCLRASSAEMRSSTFRLTQRRMKSWHDSDRSCGYSGRWSVEAISYMSENLLVAFFHGCIPVDISTTVIPVLQMSEARPYRSCRITSGAIQNGVPRIEHVSLPSVTVPRSWADAPKSAILRTPLAATRMLAPLMSRCITACSWMYARPSMICRVYWARTGSGKAPKELRRVATEPPGQNSMMMLNEVSMVCVPTYDTT